MNLSSFQNSYKFFQFFPPSLKKKKIQATTVKLLVQSPGIFSSFQWNLAMKTSKIRNVEFFFQDFQKKFRMRRIFFKLI